MTLEAEFDQAMRKVSEESIARGYAPTKFMQMVEKYGGLETSRRLLAESEAQSGLFTLWELDLLDESMEAWVIKPKFRSLFTPIELAEARRRLEELNYAFPDEG
jgi:hypothetical protein